MVIIMTYRLSIYQIKKKSVAKKSLQQTFSYVHRLLAHI